MRRTLVLFSTLLLLVALTLTVSAYDKCATVNALSLTYGSIGATYETRHNDTLSLVLGARASFYALSRAGFTGLAGVRYYKDSTNMDGIYFEGRGFAGITIYGAGSSTTFMIGPGVSGGYKYVFDKGYTVDVGLGLGLPFYINTATGFWVGFDFEPRVALGYSW